MMTNNIRIQLVNTKKLETQFCDVARCIYKKDENWISPLDSEINKIFSLKHNDSFEHGDARRWIAFNKYGHLIGRIAVFYDNRKKANNNIKYGSIGFFESIDNEEVSNLLFNKAKFWLKKNGYEGFEGPVNFGKNDRYWGLLVEGFSPTPFTTNYHKPYYKKLFENYGFKEYYSMISSVIDLDLPVHDRVYKIANWIIKKPGISFQHPSIKNLKKFAKYFQEIYNEAWAFHEDYTPISDQQVNHFAKEYRHMFIDYMSPFVFVNNEPAGFIICTPDLNQIIKPFAGKLNIFKKLLFMWRKRNNYSWYRKNNILTQGHAIAIGIKPKFRNYGLEAGMIFSSFDKVRKLGIKKLELRWAGDFNPKIVSMHKAIGAIPIRKHLTYRLNFDISKPIEKHSNI